MALEALSSNELLNFIIYDTISATQYSSSCNDNTTNTNNHNFLFDINTLKTHHHNLTTTITTEDTAAAPASMARGRRCRSSGGVDENPIHHHHHRQQLGAVVHQQQGRKKRRRRQRICKNKEEAETQRMTHIAVERNRRKQMNEHLAVLRSLMPESYVQRGDQASIVGGAIEFVKELEQHLQTLEAQKFILIQQQNNNKEDENGEKKKKKKKKTNNNNNNSTPFAQFFSYPQYTCCSTSSSSSCSSSSSSESLQLQSQLQQMGNNNNNNKYTSKSKSNVAAIADIEVTLIETHANVRILSRRRFRQLSKLVTAFQTLYLTILHLNVTTLEPLVLYSLSSKVEEGCPLNSADDIAAAVHHILRIIDEEANAAAATLCSQDSSL